MTASELTFAINAGVCLKASENAAEYASSWPWEMWVIEPEKLTQSIRVRSIPKQSIWAIFTRIEATILESAEHGDTNPNKRLMSAFSDSRQRKFVERVMNLPAEARQKCCRSYALSRAVRYFQNENRNRVELSPAFLSENPENEYQFPVNTIGMIRHALWGMTVENVPLSRSLNDSYDFGFRRCPAFAIAPHAMNWFVFIPALYVGAGDTKKAIQDWRALLWYNDVEYSYRDGRIAIRRAWLTQNPNTSEPDPVYRFLRKPTRATRDEALVFLSGHAGDTQLLYGSTSKRGRRPDPKATELGRLCYEALQDGVKASNIIRRVQAALNRPITDSDVYTYAKRYARRFNRAYPPEVPKKHQFPTSSKP